MKFIISSLIAWRVWLSALLLIAVGFFPSHPNFVGGGLEHYIRFPWFWGWANFDGEHYLAIAQHGYGAGEQAFFPLYPLLIRIIAWFWQGDLYVLQTVGLLISHGALVVALVGLWKLIKLDFDQHIAKITLILLLVFPTSFYFGSVYTESLFLLFVVWSFYCARKNHWLWVGILGAGAAATRTIGILLLPALLIEWWTSRQKKSRDVLFLLLIPTGLLAYMYYLQQTVDDSLAFLHTLTLFGEQRSALPILLPQVFWRYIKMIPDVNLNDPFLVAFILESGTAVIFFAASVVIFWRLRLSYALFTLLAYIAPTLSGSFSSLSRYALPLFPAFLLAAIFIKTAPSWVRVTTLVILLVFQAAATMLFVRGYWIA